MTSDATYSDAVTYVLTEKILIKIHYRETGTGLANRDSSSTNGEDGGYGKARRDKYLTDRS